MADFDNIEEKKAQNEENAVSTCVSVLPCVPSSEPTPDTPNINQIREIFSKFGRSDDTDVSVIERTSTSDLCVLSTKLLEILPSITDSQNACNTHVIGHFTTIKKFYSSVQNFGYDSPSLQLLFTSIQIYEAVCGIAFVAFNEYPATLSGINEQLNRAISKIERHPTRGCLVLTCFGVVLLSKFNKILEIIDQKLGEMGVIKVAEFVSNIIEVFCKFFNINTHDFASFSAIAESISEFVNKITSTLKSVFGDDTPRHGRSKKWGALAVTEKIKAKLSKFEAQSAIVQRTVASFERLYKAVEKIDDDFETSKVSQSQQRAVDGEDDQTQINIAQIVQQTNESAFKEVEAIGRLFQQLETILSYGILLFKNEDEILSPLLDYVDECSRIIEKFISLHVFYKILCAKNYLSKLKVIFKDIVRLLENSKLKFNSPKEFLAEFNKNYPNLLLLVCESLVNDKFKKKIEFLPDGLENVINNAMDDAFSKFKKKLKF